MPRFAVITCIAVFTLALAIAATACGSGSDAGAKGGVTIEPAATNTATIRTGGKPEAPPATATVACRRKHRDRSATAGANGRTRRNGNARRAAHIRRKRRAQRGPLDRR